MQQGGGMTIEQLLGKKEHAADSAAVDSTPEAAADDSDAWSAGDSNLSPEPAQVLGFRDNVKKAAQSAADGAAHLKDSVANKFKSFEASDADSDSAAGAGAHTTAVTLTAAVGGIFPSFLSLPVPPHTPALPPAPFLPPIIFYSTPTSVLLFPQSPSSGLSCQILLLQLILSMFLHRSLLHSLQLSHQPPIEFNPTSYMTCIVPMYMDSVEALVLSVNLCRPNDALQRVPKLNL